MSASSCARKVEPTVFLCDACAASSPCCAAAAVWILLLIWSTGLAVDRMAFSRSELMLSRFLARKPVAS